MPALPMMFSPHVFFSSTALSLTASTGPMSRLTRIGTVRNVATVNARPSSPAIQRPMKPARSSIMRRIRPTVAAIAA